MTDWSVSKLVLIDDKAEMRCFTQLNFAKKLKYHCLAIAGELPDKASIQNSEGSFLPGSCLAIAGELPDKVGI